MWKVYPFLNKPWESVVKRRAVNRIGQRLISSTVNLFSEKEPDPDSGNPLKRTFNILGKDLRSMRKFLTPQKQPNDLNAKEILEFQADSSANKVNLQTELFQTHCDVLIIGGGGVGSSIAFWLKKKARNGLNVVLIEKEKTSKKAPSLIPCHGLNQQFSLPENIQMATYCADFMRGVGSHLGDVNLNFTPYGSLVLASEEEAETLRKNSKTQNELGARNELLSKEKLEAKFPWLNTDGIVLGCHGLEKEGWFDPLAMLIGYKNKACEYGTHFVEGEVVDFEFQIQPDVLVDGEQSDCYHSLDKAVVLLPDGELHTIKFAIVIIAAGSSSGALGRLARIGAGTGLLSIPLPVEQRKRYGYILSSQSNDNPTFSTPLTVDPNGIYFRREGLSGNYICGRNSKGMGDVEKGQHVFDTEILPTLKHRVQSFNGAKVQTDWSDSYEYNTFDENGVIGPHPYYNNLYLAIGFNGHGIQQTPAVGRGIAELIIDGRFRSIDLSRLGFDRLIVNKPLYEHINF